MSIIYVVSYVLVLSRWLHFASVFVLFGASLSIFYMGPALVASAPGLSASGLPSRDLSSPGLSLPGLFWTMRCIRPLLRGAALLAFVSGLGWLVASLANMSGGFADAVDPQFLHAYLFETPFGPIAIARLVLLAALLASVALPLRSRVGFAATATLAALLLVSQAWLGHAAEGGNSLYGASMIACYAAHVLAGAAWVGGLPVLLLAISDPQSRHSAAGGTTGVLDLLSRFSRMAFVAVSVIVLSGIANTAFRVGTDVGALAAATYGTVLAVKLSFVTIMLGLAAYNRYVAMPRLRRTSPGDGRRSRSLATSLGVELAFGALVLAAVAVLGITPPPR